jgi:hypothetical protein
MPWILDGNNLAGGRDREGVRRAALAVARHERVRLVLYFDGAPPPGSGATVRLGQVEVCYVPHADSAIVARVSGGGRGWIVATDDRALAARVKGLGARAVGAADFWEKAGRAAAAPSTGPAGPTDLDSEMRYFRDPSQRLPGGATPVRRRKSQGVAKKRHQRRR